jgi:ABC-type uncharacterized transport system ATPase subunit
MVGREVATKLDRARVEPGECLVSLRRVQVLGEHGQPAVRDIDLDLAAGEVVGVAGVDGNGQSELAEALAGLRKLAGGTLQVRGHTLTASDPLDRIRHGIMYVPADRNGRGAALELNLLNNAILKTHRRPPFSQHSVLQRAPIRAFTERLVSEYRIRCASLETNAGTLSGGNLQKLIFAREIAFQPMLLVAEQPTRGLDVAATEQIHRLLLQQREAGTAVLLISADLDEIFALSDRVIVMYEGTIAFSARNERLDRERVGRAMAGLEPQQ